MLNPISNQQNYNWNYSKPEKEGYSTLLVGTVLAIQEVQKTKYNPNGPGVPEFWEDSGKPKWNIRMALATPEGQLKTFTFQPASRAAQRGEKKSIHMDLFHLTGDTDMKNLIGKTIGIQTQEGRYGAGNPRPWEVGLVEGGPYKLNFELPAEYKVPQVLANAAASGGQVQQPQPQYAQQPYGMQQPQYAPQPQYAQQPYGMQPQPYGMQPQPQYAQPQATPAAQQNMAQGYAQPAQAMPQGMNPQVANAMQQMGATNVTEVTKVQSAPATGTPYPDDECPF